jgi:inosine/xanthosine triphosphate pyrophosphatase family protein
MTRRLEGGRLVIATGNAGKLEEMRELLAPAGSPSSRIASMG